MTPDLSYFSRILRRSKNNLKSKLSLIASIKVEYKCPKKWYGNEYGGFYINDTLLDPESIVYSFGIGQDISFDLEVINNHKCKVYGFDPTPKSISWVKEQQFPENFIFEGIGIGKVTETANFNLPKNENFVSGSLYEHEDVNPNNHVLVQLETLPYIANKLRHKTIDVLKMDIEGAEYDIIDNVLNSNIPIKQILLEIHARFFKNGKEKTELLLEKLRKNGYKLFAVSDSYQELSFIKIS